MQYYEGVYGSHAETGIEVHEKMLKMRLEKFETVKFPNFRGSFL